MTVEQKLQAFCKNVKAIRKNNNLTQRQSAEICGVSVSVIQKLEHGIIPSRASLKVMISVSRHFGCTVESLLVPFE